MDAIPALAESFPQHSIVIRPHVGDKEEFWQEKAVGFAPNVHVVREFSVSPWLVAADLMLHNSCTTSIEAWVGNIPAIAYSEPFPGEEDFQMFPLTNSVSMVCSSRAELINSVREVVSSGKRNKLVSSEIADYFMTIPSAGYSSEAIVSCLEALDIDKVTFIPEDYNLSTKIRERLSLARTRFSDFMKNNEYGYSYRKKKNPGMSYEEVIRVIDKLKSVRPMFAGIETKQVARDTFCIFKPAPNISDS